MKARARKAAAMTSSLDPFVDAIIALARRAVNTQSRGLAHSASNSPEASSSSTPEKRNLHDVQENHTPGPARRGREIQELGQVGAERRGRHAQLYASGDIIAAARLVRKGKVISLALNFDHTGPQGAKSNYPAMGRTNPIHTMIRTGTDAYSGVLDKRGIRAADDMVTMPLQCGTQWDGL